jgi:K+-transporting ATPase KdpF subunit
MNTESTIGLVVVVLCAIYLVYVMLRPERF